MSSSYVPKIAAVGCFLAAGVIALAFRASYSPRRDNRNTSQANDLRSLRRFEVHEILKDEVRFSPKMSGGPPLIDETRHAPLASVEM